MNELVFPDEIQIEELRDDYGRIVIEPLERGFGSTLGNSRMPDPLIVCTTDCRPDPLRSLGLLLCGSMSQASITSTTR